MERLITGSKQTRVPQSKVFFFQLTVATTGSERYSLLVRARNKKGSDFFKAFHFSSMKKANPHASSISN